MAKNRSVEKEEFWRLVLQEQLESGLTIKAFCLQQGISQPSFYAWRKRICNRDSDVTGQQPVDRSQRLIPVDIVAVDQTPAGIPTGKAAGQWVIEVATPSGCITRCHHSVSVEKIASLIEAVENRLALRPKSC